MAECARCPSCGNELSANTPQGLCPECLLRQALESEAPTAPPGPAATVPATPGGGPSAEDDGPEPGASVHYFGDYELVKQLGRGGMGVVYKARQLSLNRPVALKLLKSDILAGDDERRRFQNEAEAVALLDHPHIVPIFEVGEHEGRQFFSMKLVGGPSLEKKLSDYAADPKAAARLVNTAAEAVHHAHQRGILHRDLKPSNILLDERGEPYVTDFGLAKRVEGDSELTQSGAIVGTPAFMAPEQASGRRGAVTTSTDVYGLGAILYSLLTERAPFHGDSMADTLQAVRESVPKPPSTINPNAPRDLELICLKCLEKESRRRYGSGQALADELDRYLLGKPIEARPVGILERAWLWCRRNSALSVLAASLVLALITGTIVSTVFALIASDRSRQANRQAELAMRRLYDVRMTQIPGYRDNWNPDLFLRTLNEQLPENQAGVDRRGFEWHYWHNKILTEEATLRGHKRAVTSIAFNASGNRLASASMDGTIRLWNTQTGQTILICKRGQEGTSRVAALSPDASRIASIVGDMKLGVWDTETGRQIPFSAIPDSVLAAFFSHDGSKLVTFEFGRVLDNQAAKIVRVLDLATGKTAFTVGERELVYTLAVNTAGPWMAWAGADLPPEELTKDGGRKFANGNLRDLGGKAEIWDVRHANVVATLRSSPGTITNLSFSGDGRRAATASPYPDGIVKIWETRAGREIVTLKESSLFDRPGAAFVGGTTIPIMAHLDMTLNHDGSRLATCNAEGTLKIWDAQSGHTMFTLNARQRFALAFSPDGTQLAAAGADGQLILMDAESGRESLTLLKHTIDHTRTVDGGNYGVAFSPDGSRLVSIGDDGTIKVWIASLRQDALTLNADCPLNDVAFSPDGRRVAAAGSDGLVHIWDASDGRPMPWLREQSSRVSGVAFSPDGSRIASAIGDETVTVWDWTIGVRIQVLKARKGDHLSSVAFSPDGLRIAGAGSSGRVVSWDVMTGQEVCGVTGGGYNPRARAIIAFSPDGKRIASSDPRTGVNIRNASNGAEVFKLGEGNIMAFSPDGSWIALCARRRGQEFQGLRNRDGVGGNLWQEKA